MNVVILMGRLTKDPDVRYSAAEKAVATFTLAVNRKFKSTNGGDDTDFIRCVAFGNTGESVERYLMKGKKVVIEGRWQTGKYTGNDGKTVFTNDCVVERWEFAESKGEGSSSDEYESRRPSVETTTDGFMTIPDGIEDELPFN